MNKWDACKAVGDFSDMACKHLVIKFLMEGKITLDDIHDPDMPFFSPWHYKGGFVPSNKISAIIKMHINNEDIRNQMQYLLIDLNLPCTDLTISSAIDDMMTNYAYQIREYKRLFMEST